MKTVKSKGSNKMRLTLGVQHYTKSKEWLTINYVVNVGKTTLSRFYIFRGERIHDDYVQLCKFET
jgi:hypothetical protein